MAKADRKRTAARIPAQVVAAVRAAEDKKAVDLVALDLRKAAGFTDYFIICTGTNPRQIRAIADGVMEALAHDHGETAILTAPGGTHAMCLASVESDHHAMRLSYDRWRTAPMHLGASAKVLLAHLDDAHAERILADPPPHPTGGPEPSEATLRAQIAATRRDGYLVTDGELDAGATAVAAPVLDGRGRPVAGLSLTGPTDRIHAALERIVPAVTASAATIARRIEAP